MSKQVILIRQDLQLPKGKLAAQSAHASVEAVLKSDSKTIKEWRNEGMAKIVLKVKDEKELFKYKKFAEESLINIKFRKEMLELLKKDQV